MCIKSADVFIQCNRLICCRFCILFRGFGIHDNMNTRNREIDKAALAILRSTGISILDAALVAKTALEAGGARLRQNGNLSAYSEVRASETTALRALKRSKKSLR